jgi:hypothetical protein
MRPPCWISGAVSALTTNGEFVQLGPCVPLHDGFGLEFMYALHNLYQPGKSYSVLCFCMRTRLPCLISGVVSATWVYEQWSSWLKRRWASMIWISRFSCSYAAHAHRTFHRSIHSFVRLSIVHGWSVNNGHFFSHLECIETCVCMHWQLSHTPWRCAVELGPSLTHTHVAVVFLCCILHIHSSNPFV